jgi:hypothetical protein
MAQTAGTGQREAGIDMRRDTFTTRWASVAGPPAAMAAGCLLAAGLALAGCSSSASPSSSIAARFLDALGG